MDRSSPFWTSLRLALVILSGPLWIVIRFNMPDDFSRPPNLAFPFVLAGFSAFGVIAWWALNSDPNSLYEWSRPSWGKSPFGWHQPMQGLHLTAWSSAVGAVCLLIV